MRLLISALFLVIGLSIQAANPTTTKSVDTIADLQALLVADKHDTVNVRGYLSVNDGGQGVFELEPTSVATADGGIYIAPNAGAGRWKRVVQGRDYIARWWGPNKTNSTIQSAIDWVSANGHGKVICDGGTWTVKCDDSTRITMKDGVTLVTADDSTIVMAPNPVDNWIMVDFPLDVRDCGVGPARLVGWNLNAPGGDTNKVGMIFSIQDTHNVTIGGVEASNWYTRYADVGSGNENLQLFDQNWERGVKAFGAKMDGVTDDTIAVQDSIFYAERYSREVFFPGSSTNHLLMTTTWITNNVPILIKGNGARIDVYYSQPGDVTNNRLSAAFIIGSHNVTIDGLKFKTVSTNYNPITEEATTSGYYSPINIYIATNVVIRNCEFDVYTGRGIISSGSYGVIQNCKFFNGCGITYGVGQPHNWLYFQNTVPLGADQIFLSPIGCQVIDNYFTGSNAFKRIVFFSAANRFTFSRNKMIDIWSPDSAVTAYSGDLGVTDSRGTNVYEYSGMISENTITGRFGAEGAIKLTMVTPTNYLATVAPWFNPLLMYSTVIMRGNQIQGIGDGYHTIAGRGTKIEGGDNRVTGYNYRLYGDCTGQEIVGVNNTSDGMAIIFGTAFLAPGNFKNVKIRNSSFTVGAGAEYWMRDISDKIDSLLVENCDVYFLGASGSGDAPAVFQFTAQPTNYIRFVENRFYLTNGIMNGRRIGTFSGTNCDFTMVNNQIIPLSSTAVPRGPSFTGRTVLLRGNEMRNLEVAYADELLAEDNIILYGDGQRPVEIGSPGRPLSKAKISGNRILGTNTTTQLAALIYSTNSTFSDNIVKAFTGSDIVQCGFGRMLVHNNVIENTGVGFVFPTTTGTGIISDDIYEQPLHVDSPASVLPPMRISRAGGGAALRLDLDQHYQTFSREAIFSSRPIDTNDAGGFAFFIHHADGTEEFAFGAEADIQGTFRVGSDTNVIDLALSSVGTNVMMYVDNDHKVRPVTMGGNMTFAGGTLNSLGGGGGGSTNDTPWQLDHDANQFSLTNGFGINLRHNDSSATYYESSNTVGNAKFSLNGSGAISLENTSTTTSGVNFVLDGSTRWTLNNNNFGPSATGKSLASSTVPLSQGYFSTIGIFVGPSIVRSGAGSPEGLTLGDPGSIWLRTNGGAGLTLYVKETGTGNTGWVAYKSSATGSIPTSIAIACSDLSTPITAGTFKGYLRMPFAMTVSSVKASLSGAQTSGSIFTVDINEAGTTVLSTKITLDNTEKTSTTAATAAVISDTALANDAEISVDVDQAGTSPTGLIVYLEGFR